MQWLRALQKPASACQSVFAIGVVCLANFSMSMNFHCLIHKSCTRCNRFPWFRHRHLPPPWARQALQALQACQARQVQLPPAVSQVPLLLRCREFTWRVRNEASSAVGCWWKMEVTCSTHARYVHFSGVCHFYISYIRLYSFHFMAVTGLPSSPKVGKT